MCRWVSHSVPAARFAFAGTSIFNTHFDTMAPGFIAMRKRWQTRPRGWRMAALITAITVAVTALWAAVYRHDTRRLSENTRIVVRIPVKLFDEMTADVVDEQFSFRETANGGVFEGAGHAAGTVRVSVNGDEWNPGFVIHVRGTTFGPISGMRSSVTLEGNGRGTFEARQIIRFDGRNFRAGELTVTSGHETTIRKVEATPGTPLAGPVRLVAMRSARAVATDWRLDASQRGRSGLVCTATETSVRSGQTASAVPDVG